MRTTVALDDELLAEARRLTGTTENSALLRQALTALIERESSRRLAKLGGSEEFANQLFRSINQHLSRTLGALHEGNLYAKRLFGFLATEPVVEVSRGSAAEPAAGRPPRIVFEQVGFRYPGTDRMVLTDLDLSIEPGESVALVGNNGAGKSTVVKLLVGLYEPTAGRILLDGIDIASLDRSELRARLSVVFQDFVIYHFSAWDNVGFGRLDRLADRAAVEAVARQSGLDRVVRQLPDGYDTVLGRFWEKGHELSGGQRQLVALARALLRQAPVLVLDEPSSALDVRTERAFFERLLDGEADRTTILISHRYSTVRRADRILVLADGRLVEQGSHDELMRLAGEYAEMYRLHSAAFQPTDEAGRQAGAAR